MFFQQAFLLLTYSFNNLDDDNDIQLNRSRYGHDFRGSLDNKERKKRANKVPRLALLSVHSSPWRKLIESSSDPALITFTGFDKNAFYILLEIFGPYFDEYTPFTTSGKISLKRVGFGRPRKIRPEDCLGLSLAWTRTRGSKVQLNMSFGMTATNCALYIKFGLRILVRVLNSHEKARVAIPSDDLLTEYAQSIENRHNNLQNVWSTMDGLKLEIEIAPETDRQALFYNGWVHGHYISNIFVFTPAGTIPICCLNMPGSYHDSTICDLSGIYTMLEDVYNKLGYRCCVDSAFRGRDSEFLIKSSQDNLVAPNGLSGEEAFNAVRIQQEATSLRQSAEWGMRAFQSMFPRCKDKIHYEENGERRIMLKSMVLLYNFRSNVVGINQIRNVYMARLEETNEI